MAYFVFNPQTNSLDTSDNPTPIRKNLGQKLLAKDDNIYPWGYDKNPPWAYIPKDPFDPSIHERFLEDFDIRNETMHADGGRVGFADGPPAGTDVFKITARYHPHFGEWRYRDRNKKTKYSKTKPITLSSQEVGDLLADTSK